MSTRCKPGDLAFITYSSIHENIGRVVEVVRLDLFVGPLDRNPGRVMWIVATNSPCSARHRLTGNLVFVPAGGEMAIPDAQLTPITGLPLNEETHDEVTA